VASKGEDGCSQVRFAEAPSPAAGNQNTTPTFRSLTVGSVTVRFAALADLAAELKAWAGRPMSRACGLMQSPGSTRIRGRITAIKNQIMVHIMLW
jgi:hypothetical protein